MDQPGQNWYKSNMSQIESFNLFGEQQDLPDVVHCETIEARSLLHNWEFSPHRHSRLHQFLLVDSGGGEVRIEARAMTLHAGHLVNVPTGVVHGFSFTPGTQGWVVTVAAELMDESLSDGEGLRPILARPAVIEAGSETRSTIKTIFEEYPTRSFARAHILRALCAGLAGRVARRMAAERPTDTRPDSPLQRRFEALLEEHHSFHLGVSDYARLLAVTPTHPSRVMRAATGQSASAAIEARMIREARRNLAFSNLAVAEIGYQLGFEDPSYFSRVFKRVAGQSPRDFRRGLERQVSGPAC